MAAISRSVLADAKAFLCWDTLDNLAIQLVPLQNAAAFYYPPKLTVHSIVLFFDADQNDFFEPLCLLFHEAGHKQQFTRAGADFEQNMAIPTGRARQDFERQAWQLARDLFEQFINRRQLDGPLLHQFDRFAEKSIDSYAEHL